MNSNGKGVKRRLEGRGNFFVRLDQKLEGRDIFWRKMKDRKESDISCVVFHNQALIDFQRNLGPFGK